MADLNSTLVRGNLRVTEDTYLSGTTYFGDTNYYITGSYYNGTAALANACNNADYPTGFTSKTTDATWTSAMDADGYTTFITGWVDSLGGDIAFKDNGSGALSCEIDGYFYQGCDGHGSSRVVDTTDIADMATKTWTTSQGYLTGIYRHTVTISWTERPTLDIAMSFTFDTTSNYDFSQDTSPTRILMSFTGLGSSGSGAVNTPITYQMGSGSSMITSIAFTSGASFDGSTFTMYTLVGIKYTGSTGSVTGVQSGSTITVASSVTISDDIIPL